MHISHNKYKTKYEDYFFPCYMKHLCYDMILILCYITAIIETNIKCLLSDSFTGLHTSEPKAKIIVSK